jgi:hypothetical protein
LRAAGGTEVRYYITLFRVDSNKNWFHFSFAGTFSVAWDFFVHMEGIEAFSAVIALVGRDHGIFLFASDANETFFS